MPNDAREYARHALRLSSAVLDAPVAQLDRASGFEPEGRGFESLPARQRIRTVACYGASEREPTAFLGLVAKCLPKDMNVDAGLSRSVVVRWKNDGDPELEAV
jgi:hypothetical protein